MKNILVIAGSDSCGGAGIQADIKTISSLGAHALTAITAITAQNTLGISGIHKVPAAFISKQLDGIIDDLAPDAVKIGMLYSRGAVREVAKWIKTHKLPNVVLDPILKASTGVRLLESEALKPMKEFLIPLARVITPNLYEAGVLSGRQVRDLDEMVETSRLLKGLGPDVVITGGHLKDECVDVLYDGKTIHRFSDLRIDTIHTHGSGCVFSTALATFLGEEKDVIAATNLAHEFARSAILRGYVCGRGAGVVRPGPIR